MLDGDSVDETAKRLLGSVQMSTDTSSEEVVVHIANLDNEVIVYFSRPDLVEDYEFVARRMNWQRTYGTSGLDYFVDGYGDLLDLVNVKYAKNPPELLINNPNLQGLKLVRRGDVRIRELIDAAQAINQFNSGNLSYEDLVEYTVD